MLLCTLCYRFYQSLYLRKYQYNKHLQFRNTKTVSRILITNWIYSTFKPDTSGRNNKLKDLKDIHKKIKYIGKFADFRGNPIQSHVLCLLQIEGLKRVYLDDPKVEKIINQHLAVERDLLDCKEELMKAGLKEFGRTA